MIIKDNDFSYKIGNCSTDIPWHRPDPYNLTLWKEQLFNKIGDLNEYKIWLVGASIEGRATWDVDFIITGKLNNKSRLQSVMESMVNIGFENRILIDVWWCDELEDYIEKGHLCKKMQVACQETIEIGYCTGTKCLKPRKIAQDIIVLGDSIYKNGVQVKKHKTSARISDGLWLIKGSEYKLSEPFFHQKHKKHVNQTKYNKTYPILLTKETNFYNYIRWP